MILLYMELKTFSQFKPETSILDLPLKAMISPQLLSIE